MDFLFIQKSKPQKTGADTVKTTESAPYNAIFFIPYVN